MGWLERAAVGLASVSVLFPWIPGRPVEATDLPFASSGSLAGVVSTPSAHQKNGVCLVTGAPSVIPGTSPLVVAPHPTGATLVWLPGLDATPCSTTTTHAGAPVARALARDIAHAPSLSPRAEFNCPNDDGAAAVISFTYAHHRTFAPIVVGLSGCRFVTASGKLRRSTTTSLGAKLATLAPCGWKANFSDATGAC
jgi:hypothetical protein